MKFIAYQITPPYTINAILTNLLLPLEQISNSARMDLLAQREMFWIDQLNDGLWSYRDIGKHFVGLN